MSRTAVALVVSVVVAGQVLSSFLIPGLRDSGGLEDPAGGGGGNPSVALRESVESLRRDVERLSALVASGVPPAIPAGDAAAALVDLTERSGEVIRRLEALEESIVARNETRDELAALEICEKLEAQFRAGDGSVLAEALLAEEKFAMGANGILTFLESHPDHPDEQDLLRRARDGFRQSGYLDKALWLQGEIMKKFPEHRGGDLYLISRLETRMKRYDDALLHIDESVELATTDEDRMNRRFYRAEIVHQRDGDRAGLAAYREVERLAEAAGVGTAVEAAKRADRIEERLAGRPAR